MQTAGLFPGNAALELTRRGQRGRVQRAIYAKALQRAIAIDANAVALSQHTVNPRNVPYVGLNGLGETDDITFNPDGSINTFAVDGQTIRASDLNTSGGSDGIVASGSGWSPTYANQSTPSDNGSWTGVLTTFLGGIGKGIGERISGNKGITQVPLPSQGPSIGVVLGVAALVGIPVIYFLTRKG